jgi:hypothetical protein
MTVTTDGIHPAARPYVSRFPGGEPPLPGPSLGPAQASAPPSPPGGDWQPAAPTVEHRSWGWATPGTWVLDEWRVEWRIGWTAALPRGTWEHRWTGPIEGFSWSFGPFDPTRVEILFDDAGPILVDRTGARFDAFASWRVMIRGFERAPERRVLGAWQVHWVRLTPPQVERWWTTAERLRVGAYRRETVTIGASEAFMMAEQGASELWRIGASERVWLGGSEWLAMGGSETIFGGASGFLFGGASGALFGGASALSFGGASEWTYAGASESWRALLGGSEAYIGGSEAFARPRPPEER